MVDEFTDLERRFDTTNLILSTIHSQYVVDEFLALCPLVFQGKVDFLEENNQDELCYYLFSLASQEVCGIEPGQLSAGEILLIM